jgi:twitching motility two-component system response regulator PilH
MAEKKRILVIDDDPDALEYLRAVLEDNEYEAVTAVDGEDGLSKARAKPPAVILLDLLMPKKSGMKFLNEIKQDESLKKIPIVVESGATQVTGVDIKRYLEEPPYRERKAKALGIDIDITPEGYLEKPIDPEVLLEILKKLG